MGRLSQREKDEREERMILAIHHSRKSTEPSIRATAEKYSIAYSTLRDRLGGAQSRKEIHRHQQLLTEQGEKSMVRWILKMDEWCFPPRMAIVKEMAAVLVKNRTSNRNLGKHTVLQYILDS
jgi:hypothetical protein